MPKEISRTIPSMFIALVCIEFYIFHANFAFSTNCALVNRLLFHFSHANIYHLLINLIALFQFRPRWKTCFVAYIVSTSCAFIPVVSLSVPTLGLSGFIMACYARKYASWQMNPLYLIGINVILAFLPNFNWRIHVVAFLISYAIWLVITRIKKK
jgi:hypothetical protein